VCTDPSPLIANADDMRRALASGVNYFDLKNPGRG